MKFVSWWVFVALSNAEEGIVALQVGVMGDVAVSLSADPFGQQDPATTKGKDKTCRCTRIFSPVCGSDRKTYSNSCMAVCNGAKFARVPCHGFEFKEGKQGDSSCPDGFVGIKDQSECDEARKKLGLKRCSKQWLSKKKSRLPHCWIRNGKANFNANGDVGNRKRIRQSSLICKSTLCRCEEILDPVCGAGGKTYDNACEAGCDGAKWTPGPCKPEPCICTAEFNPVCGQDGTTYSNACRANCAGVKCTPGPCKPEPCICTLQFKPVCGDDGATYGNACQADCAGVKSMPGPCKPEPCICTREYKPVCGEDGTTYSNACQAGCAGVKWTPGPCKPGRPMLPNLR